MVERIPYTGMGGHAHRSTDITDFESAVLSIIGAATPVGTLIHYAFSDVPSGYLRMDGQTVNYDDYPILGAKYGSVAGGTFVLEDMRGIPLFGADGSNTARSITGSDTVNLAHTHSTTGTAASAGAHTHTMAHTHQIDPQQQQRDRHQQQSRPQRF